jgi:hypothetical protein
LQQYSANEHQGNNEVDSKNYIGHIGNPILIHCALAAPYGNGKLAVQV